jgi:hypothetical protein
MARELAPIDISLFPELAQLIEEVESTHQPRRIRRDGQDVAIVVPATSRLRDAASVFPLPRYPSGGIVAATAGVVQYDGPVLTSEQERDAFERGVAAEVEEHLEE